MMSGRGSYRNYVEFDVASAELRSARGIKGIWPINRYQRVMEPGIGLSGRKATFGALGPNYGQRIVVWGVLPAVGVGTGYVVYQAAKKN
jgi:hypothetical protein